MKDTIRYSAGLGIGIAGAILGIISLMYGIFGDKPLVATISGILGITFSSIAWSQARQAGAKIGIMLLALLFSVSGTSLAIIQFTQWNPLKEDTKPPHDDKNTVNIPLVDTDETELHNSVSDTASWEDILESLEEDKE